MTFRPRSDRDRLRGKRAWDACKASGGTAIKCAEAQIDATFGVASIHNRIKREIDVAIRQGADSGHVRAWYGRMAREIAGQTIDDAIKTLKFNYAVKQRQFVRRRNLSGPELITAACAPHLHVERIYGAIVMLRLMRRKLTDAQFVDLIDRVTGAQTVTLIAAE